MIQDSDSQHNGFPPTKMAKTLMTPTNSVSVAHVSSMFSSSSNLVSSSNINRPSSSLFKNIRNNHKGMEQPTTPSSHIGLMLASPTPTIADTTSLFQVGPSQKDRTTTSSPVLSSTTHYDIQNIRSTVLMEYLPGHLKTTLQTGTLRSDARSLASRRHKAAIIRTLTALAQGDDVANANTRDNNKGGAEVLQHCLHMMFDGIWADIEESVETQRNYQLSQKLSSVSMGDDDVNTHKAQTHKQLLLQIDQRMRGENWLRHFKSALEQIGCAGTHANVTLMIIVYTLVQQIMRCRVKSLLLVRSRRGSSTSLRSQMESRSQTPTPQSDDEHTNAADMDEGEDSTTSKSCDGAVVGPSDENALPRKAHSSSNGDSDKSLTTTTTTTTSVENEGSLFEEEGNFVSILFADPSELVTAICKDIVVKDTQLLRSFLANADDATKKTSQYIRRQFLLAVYSSIITCEHNNHAVESKKDLVLHDSLVKVCWLLERAITPMLKKQFSNNNEDQQKDDSKLRDALTTFVMKNKKLFAAWGSVVDAAKTAKKEEHMEEEGMFHCLSSKDQLRVLVTFAHRYYLSRSSHFVKALRFKKAMAHLSTSRGKRSFREVVA